MELWDIYNIDKEKTGKIINRHSDEMLKSGEYHLVVEAIIINSRKEILLNKRAKFKQKYPLMWECLGGASVKGESSLQAILREIKEELGLDFKDKDAIFYKTVRNDNSKYFKDIWLFKKELEIEELKYTDNEVIDSKWVTIDEFEKMYRNNKIVPTIDFTKKDYEKVCKL